MRSGQIWRRECWVYVGDLERIGFVEREREREKGRKLGRGKGRGGLIMIIDDDDENENYERGKLMGGL